MTSHDHESQVMTPICLRPLFRQLDILVHNAASAKKSNMGYQMAIGHVPDDVT